MASEFTIKRGEEDSYSMNLAPFDLTGATVYFTVKTNRDDADPGVLQKTIVTHDDAANGLTTLSLTRTDTDLTPGPYWFDIVIVKSGLVKYTDPARFVVQETVKDTVS